MGQLERYGLYVLCLVIFLILGVAMWGDGAAAQAVADDGPSSEHRMLSKDQKIDDFQNSLDQKERDAITNQQEVESLFKPAEPPKKDSPREVPGVDPKVASTPPVDDKQGSGIRIHRVKKGDTLGGLAQKYLGDDTAWPEIVAINPGVTEHRLQLNSDLKIPARKSKRKGKKQSSSTGGGRDHVVRRGESPWSIAAREYGRGAADKYSKLILKLNKMTLADFKPDVVIKLPPAPGRK